MSTTSRLDALYESNIPNVRNNNETCDSFKTWYNQIIANLTANNASITSWHATWVAIYDPDITDVSLSTIYASDKPLFAELQTILTDQKDFFDDIKGKRLLNNEAISFTWGASTGQERVLKGQYTHGKLPNLSTDVSLSNILNTASDADLDTNKWLVRHQYQIGTYNGEAMLLDLHFGGGVPGDISDLYDRAISATDGTSIISQNKRMIRELQFSVNRANDIQTMLTYIRK